MQNKAVVSSITSLSPSVKLISLNLGKSKFTYYPGQWVDIHLTINDEAHNCGYSIVSSLGDTNSIDIAVKLAPELPLTVHLHNKTKPGDEIFISDAQGDIALKQTPAGNYVFIAGGVGITPLISMIQFINRSSLECSITLIYSVTTLEELLFKSLLDSIRIQNSNFQYYVTVTRQRHHDQAFTGRINPSMLSSIPLPGNASYYLCGPPEMVDAVAEMLSDINIMRDKIHFDRWWS